MATIRQTDGPICGVIHGAGVESASKFSKKKLRSVDRSIAVKVDGAAALLAILADEPPKFFVGLGSTSGRFGGLGQTDYSLANDMLSKLVSQLRHDRPDCAAVCMDWSSWDEIGMSARPESKFALQGLNVRFMPPRRGVDHLIDELQAQGVDAEVLVVDHPGCASTHITMSDVDSPFEFAQPATPSNLDSPASQSPANTIHAKDDRASAERGEIQAYLKLVADTQGSDGARAAIPPAAMQAVFNARTIDELRAIADRCQVALVSLLAHNRQDLSNDELRGSADRVATATGEVANGAARSFDTSLLPMLESVHFDSTRRELVATALVDPKRDIFLREHRLYRRPFLPAVVSAEILAEAASQLFPGRTLTEIHDLDLLAGHTFVSDAPVSLEARITQEGAASCRCELALNPGVGNATRLVTMKATFADKPLSRETMAVREPGFGWIPFQYPDDWAVFYHGPAFRTYREFAFQHDGGRARLVAPKPDEMAGDRAAEIHWMTPSALLDGAMMACGSYAYFMLEGKVAIPRRFDRLRFYAQPRAGEVCMLRLFIRRIEETGTSYDFQLIGNDGSVYFVAEGFDMICIKDDGKQ